MKKTYEIPTVEVLKILANDCITVSSTTDDGSGDDYAPMPDSWGK